MEIRPFLPADEPAVVRLWQACGLVVPANDPGKDIRRKLVVQPELFLVGVEEGRVVAAVMAGYDGHRGWLNYLAVAPERRRRGLGRRMVAAAEERLRARGCPKINLQVRRSNPAVLEFYRRLGFAEDAVVSLGKRLETD
jgi:ribosomal protein S18 acetylase RimI-like enzyme